MKLIVRSSNGEITEREITEDMELNPSAGEQYFFTGVENYTFDLTDNDSSMSVHFLDNNGERVHITLDNMAGLIQQNDPTDPFSMDTSFGVSTNEAGDQAIENILHNETLENGEIIEALKDALSMDGSTLAGGAVVDDFQALLEALDASATGDVMSTAYNLLDDENDDQDVTPTEDSGSERPDSPDEESSSDIDRSSSSFYNEEESTTPTVADILDVTEEEVIEPEPPVEPVLPVEEEPVEIKLSSQNESHTINFEEDSGSDGAVTETSSDAANIVIVLDTSGSMRANGGDGQSRLELAKESLEDMINTYKDFGGVNVRLTTFSSEGTAGSEWMSANEAIEAINNLTSGGMTNYEDALFETYDNYTEAPNGEKASVYFISDGTPTRENKYDADVDSDSTDRIHGEAVDDDYIVGWTEFLEANAKELNVIGIGTGLQENDPDFQRVAVDIGTIKTNVMVVEDVTELQETLVNSVTKEVEGNLLDNISNEEGEVTLESITIDDVTYEALDMPITTPAGATLNVDFTTGDFSYTAKAVDFANDKLESFSVNASDESGDTTTFDVNMNIDVDDGQLLFTEDMDSIDFTDVGETHTINMENEVSQELTLNADDIINANNDHEMVIVGDDGDVINLEGEGWSKQENVSVDGEEGTFDKYSSTTSDGSTVDLYVDNDMTVTTDDLF